MTNNLRDFPKLTTNQFSTLMEEPTDSDTYSTISHPCKPLSPPRLTPLKKTRHPDNNQRTRSPPKIRTVLPPREKENQNGLFFRFGGGKQEQAEKQFRFEKSYPDSSKEKFNLDTILNEMLANEPEKENHVMKILKLLSQVLKKDKTNGISLDKMVETLEKLEKQ